ncbi:MAG: nucleotide exchange factor GrpE [Elusimicrobiota bacterium]|nr:nucleotide exchange factor GrpE [Elusimicrobiota bacterium]
MTDEVKTGEVEAPAPAAPAEPDWKDQLLRLKAEFENYRKRVDREKPDFVRLGRAEVLAKLLPLHDVLRHAHQEVRAGHADSPLAKGMDAIFREFEKIFREEGVTVLEPVGKPFDPHYHEALGVVDKPGFDEDSVAEVLQAGFLLGDKVLRTAKVRLQKKTA